MSTTPSFQTPVEAVTQPTHDPRNSSPTESETEARSSMELSITPPPQSTTPIIQEDKKFDSVPFAVHISSSAKRPSLLAAGFAGFKKNLIPGLFLQLFGITFIVLYYTVNAVHDAFNSLADFKESTGYGFAILSTAFAGGLLPWCIGHAKRLWDERQLKLKQQQNQVGQQPATELVQITTEPVPSPSSDRPAISHPHTSKPPVVSAWAELLFLLILWSEKGLESDAFYQLQAIMFGSEAKVSVIATKLVVDQLGYQVVWGCWTIVASFLFKECGFSPRLWWSRIATREFWLRKLPETLITNWLVWTPASAMIYCLPTPLQIPLMDMVMCFWCLMLQFFAKQQSGATTDQDQPKGTEQQNQAISTVNQKELSASSTNTNNNQIETIQLAPTIP